MSGFFCTNGMLSILKRSGVAAAAFVAVCLAVSGCAGGTGEQADPSKNSWEEIVQTASGTTVSMMMWTGDPFINDYMNNYVKPEIADRHGIELEILDGQGTQIVSTLMAELESGRSTSQVDMMWLNGETFYQLREIDALYGPFTDQLPNSEYVNYDNPFISVDFQQPINGMEAPWGNVQFTLIYNSDKVNSPPANRQELVEWVRSNPGRFTIPVEFTGMTFLKSLLIDIAGGDELLAGEFDEEVYKEASEELWRYLNELKPYFWRQGNTFPASLAQMHQLFSNSEIWFTMSNNDSEVDNKISRGLFPNSSRAYVPEFGSIQNSHFLGISRNSPNKAGAMVVINYLLSPEAQYRKMDPGVWGDRTVLSIEKLPAEWKERFQSIPNRTHAPPRAELEQYALMELEPEYMIRMFEDFRTYVVNQ